MAKLALIIHKPYTIGIAGSVGKSSTRNILFTTLSSIYKTKLVSGNSETGIPLGILSITPDGYGILSWIKMLLLAPIRIFSTIPYSHMVVEMGIDDPYPPKNMQYLLSIIKPDIGIVLNATATHTMQFEKTLTQAEKKLPDKRRTDLLISKIADQDAKIITDSDCKIGIFNNQDQFVTNALSNFSSKSTKMLSFGVKNSTVWLDQYEASLLGSKFVFKTNINGEEDSIRIHTKEYILPEVYKDVFAPVILCALLLKVPHEKIENEISNKINLPKGRATIIHGIKDSIIIDSSYNASKEAVLTFLKLLAELKEKSKRPVVFLFGDMRELGEEAKVEHEEVADLIVKSVDELYCVGELTNKYVIPKTIKKIPSYHFASSIKAGEHLKTYLPRKAIILVKGSQNTIFLEEAVKKLIVDKKDALKLCRQEEYWMKTKSMYLQH